MLNVKRENQLKSSLFGDFLGRLMKTAAAKIGVVLLVFMVLACFVGPLLSPYEKNGIDLTNMYAKPSADHWFGCDAMGRDISDPPSIRRPVFADTGPYHGGSILFY